MSSQAVCSLHTRFDVAVCGVDAHCVAVHVVNAAHSRSELMLGARTSYSSVVQLRQFWHTRSEVGVGGVACHCAPTTQIDSAAHSRSLCVCAAFVSYWSDAHDECEAHTRLLVAVCACVSYSFDSQIVSGWQLRFDVDVGAMCSYCVALHISS